MATITKRETQGEIAGEVVSISSGFDDGRFYGFRIKAGDVDYDVRLTPHEALRFARVVIEHAEADLRRQEHEAARQAAQLPKVP